MMTKTMSLDHSPLRTAVVENDAAALPHLVRALAPPLSLVQPEPLAPQIAIGDHLVPLLYEAVLRNHLPCVAALLRLGADPNQPSRDNITYSWTPLHVAANEGWPECAVALLAAGAHADATTAALFSPLHFACACGGAGGQEVARLLIDAGADPKRRSADGRATPLLLAAQFATAATVRLLLAAGAPPEQTGRGSTPKTPLMYAAARRDGGPIRRALMAAGAPRPFLLALLLSARRAAPRLPPELWDAILAPLSFNDLCSARFI